ncbi:MAG: glycosyltransferase [Melioribacter sp.]|uniref:glycosyltransferase n=1 Tax=Melioribacter sp. TaxID=2052167 RepID=UPI003BCAB402
MKYIAYITFVFITIQLLNLIINFLFRQKLKSTYKTKQEKISILIPARNEEKNIAGLLNNLTKIKNANLEIIVYNDGSNDNTAKIVEDFVESDGRIKLITGEALPDGWRGKNFACHQMSKIAMGDYFLFIDADVRIEGDIITDAVAYVKKYGLGLLSLFPKQIMVTFGEKISVPVMNYILLTLLPLVLVRLSPFKSHSAANGQFMFFDAKTYKRFMPHKMFRNSLVEDIEIARYLKSEKTKIACVTGDERVVCRMYSSYAEALNGFSKNILMFFGNSLTAALIFWTFSALGFVPVLLSMSEYFHVYLIIFLSIQFLYSSTSKENMAENLFLFPLQMLFMLHAILNAVLIRIGKPYIWKGRYI